MTRALSLVTTRPYSIAALRRESTWTVLTFWFTCLFDRSLLFRSKSDPQRLMKLRLNKIFRIPLSGVTVVRTRVDCTCVQYSTVVALVAYEPNEYVIIIVTRLSKSRLYSLLKTFSLPFTFSLSRSLIWLRVCLSSMVCIGKGDTANTKPVVVSSRPVHLSSPFRIPIRFANKAKLAQRNQRSQL